MGRNHHVPLPDRCMVTVMGDRGQRYEVTMDDGSGKRITAGWTNHKDGNGLVQMIRNHPVWKYPIIRDRQDAKEKN